MSPETRQVLEMLKEGKITTEDAEKLLDKLGAAPSAGGSSIPGAQAAGGEGSGTSSGRGRRQQYLRIQVERPGRENVNMRIPLALVRVGRWFGMVPPRVNERLAEQGIDLSKLAGLSEDQIAEVLENTNVDIAREDGRKVRIYCE